jgi:hypothetical protein
MPNFRDIQNEINSLGTQFDVVRRKYIKALSDLTGRNVIVYYSGWLQKQLPPEAFLHFAVNDNDKNGLMATVHQLEKKRGLDLVLHTPGGSAAATESLVHYLRDMFKTDIRAIVPQLAMSAGTMIALSCKEIVMGKHSNLGPIDPQINGVPAHAIIEEFTRATSEIRDAQDPNERSAKIAVWQPIIAKYNPTLIGQCQHAIQWSNEMVSAWLKTGMFEGDPNADARISEIVGELGSHSETHTHERHIHVSRLQELGVKVVVLENDAKLQDAVLSVLHSCALTCMSAPVVKIIENQNGVSFLSVLQIMQGPAALPLPFMPQALPPFNPPQQQQEAPPPSSEQ